MQHAAPQSHFPLGTLTVPTPGLGKRMGRYHKAAQGAFSGNTERAIRADVEIFTTWCEDQGFMALPARATTVVAFIDAMAKVKAPATVRRYVSSIATMHKAVQLQNPLEYTRVKLALQRMHRKKGPPSGTGNGTHLVVARALAEGVRRDA